MTGNVPTENLTRQARTPAPRTLGFENGEQQTEERWSIDLCLQANVTITTTMQFADQLAASVVSVEAANYPASA